MSAKSREKVDHMLSKAIESGGNESREAQDHGWMYGRSFEGIDGYIWEIIYMDESPIRK
ncbi:MAG: hypothetical protein WBP64_20770 [Nitrososphaeraceae archaeon]